MTAVEPAPAGTVVAGAAVGGSRLPTLTGLRFLAALAVFCFHITLSASPIPPNDAVNPIGDARLADGLEHVFSKAGYLGVSFFFVLSGFVIAWSHRPGDPVGYVRRRLVKIFPNHLVMWVLAMVLFAGAITPTGAAVSNLFLLHSFSPDASYYVAVNPPSWTLCSELLFYLSFPLLAVGLRRLSARGLWGCAALAVLAIVAVPAIAYAWVPSTPVSALTPVSDAQFWFAYIFPVSRLPEFVLGAVLALLVRGGWRLRMSLPLAGLLVAAGYALAMVVPFAYSFVAAMVVPIAVLIVAAASADLDGRATGFQGRRWQWLGEISFGFYLCQGVVIFHLRMLLGTDVYPLPVALVVIAGFLVATLLAGWFLHACVERPAMRRWSRRRPRPSVEEGTPAASGSL